MRRFAAAALAAVLVARAAWADPLAERVRQAFAPLPAEAASPSHPISEARIELGRRLYHDARLSKSGDVSCNTCHRLDAWGVEVGSTSPAPEEERRRNAPTVYNAAFHVAQFWDGRASDVEEQARGAVLNPVEMAMPDEAAVLTLLKSIPGYAPLFAEAFPGEAEPIRYENMARAIGAFERRLVTPSRFDRFLEGDANALSANERKGLETFLDTGCSDCHNGPVAGGGTFQKLGLVEPFPTLDRGRAEVTGRAADEFFFKVPSLRNVEKTGPWFHDGSVASLDMAVRLMARHQLGKTLTGAEAQSIVAFLHALTGDLPQAYVARPELPPGGPQAPPPDPT